MRGSAARAAGSKFEAGAGSALNKGKVSHASSHAQRELLASRIEPERAMATCSRCAAWGLERTVEASKAESPMEFFVFCTVRF